MESCPQCGAVTTFVGIKDGFAVYKCAALRCALVQMKPVMAAEPQSRRTYATCGACGATYAPGVSHSCRQTVTAAEEDDLAALGVDVAGQEAHLRSLK